MTPNFVSPAVNRLVAGSNPARGAKLNQKLMVEIGESEEAKKAHLATWLATICKTRGCRLRPSLRQRGGWRGLALSRRKHGYEPLGSANYFNYLWSIQAPEILFIRQIYGMSGRERW